MRKSIKVFTFFIARHVLTYTTLHDPCTPCTRLQHDLHKFEPEVKFCKKIAKNRQHPVGFNGLQIK